MGRKKIVITHLSDIKKHDAHIVYHITRDCINHVKEKYPETNWKKAYVWSDGCTQQYKSKTSFYYLKKFHDIDIERNFFGSEHGKNESDGITGEISRKVKDAIRSRRHTFNDAEEVLQFLSKEMSKYIFKFITELELEPIINKFKGVNLKVLSGNCTRLLHQIKPGKRKDQYLIRPLSCFCCYCKIEKFNKCLNGNFTGPKFLSQTLTSNGSNDETDEEEEKEEEEEEEGGQDEYLEDGDYESDIDDQEDPLIISQQEIQLENLEEGQFIIGTKSCGKFVAIIKDKNVDSIKVNILNQEEFSMDVFRTSNEKEYNGYILDLQNIIMILPEPIISHENMFVFECPIILK